MGNRFRDAISTIKRAMSPNEEHGVAVIGTPVWVRRSFETIGSSTFAKVATWDEDVHEPLVNGDHCCAPDPNVANSYEVAQH